jgi:hypothetical protein
MIAYLKSIASRTIARRLIDTVFIFFLIIIGTGLCYLGLACYLIAFKDGPVLSSVSALVLLWVAWGLAAPDDAAEDVDVEEIAESPRIDIHECAEPGCNARRPEKPQRIPGPPDIPMRYVCPIHERKWHWSALYSVPIWMKRRLSPADSTPDSSPPFPTIDTMTPDVSDQIADTKQFRQDLDGVLQRLKLASTLDKSVTDESGRPVPHLGYRGSRERSLAITKIQEAIMWLGMDLKAINEESPGVSPNPYPESYNPASPKIEPTSEGLKL